MDNTNQENISTAKRYRTQELVQVEIRGRKEKIFCSLENLSLTGSSLKMIRAQSIPRPKDIIKMVVDLRSVNKIHVLFAQIVWVNGHDMGVNFVNPPKKTKKNFFV